jgi:hypothetical protein
MFLPTCPTRDIVRESKGSSSCPCRKRLYLANELRVLSCCFPSDWRGQPIRDNLQVKHAIQRKLGTYKESEPPKPTAPIQETTMTESNHEPTKNLPAVVTPRTITTVMSVASIKDQYTFTSQRWQDAVRVEDVRLQQRRPGLRAGGACGGDMTRAH